MGAGQVNPLSDWECCCGDPQCTDFEDRMAAWGIPLSELTVVTMTIPLGQDDVEVTDEPAQ